MIDPATREKALDWVRIFCSKPFREHGTKRKTGDFVGWFSHDWGTLARNVHKLYYGTVLEIPKAKLVAEKLRQKYSNKPTWDNAVNAPGAYDKILCIIEAEILPPGEVAATPVAAEVATAAAS